MTELQAADLAMTKNDLFAYSNARWNAPEQMKRMAMEFGLSPDAITKEYWRQLEIVHNCNHCSQHKRCYRYLTTGAGFSKDRCPNSSHYAELQQSGSD
ncbi:MAG: hypothetical protein ACR2PF_14560 [Rhizobiaceae bacterium]